MLFLHDFSEKGVYETGKNVTQTVISIDRTDIRGNIADHVIGSNGYVYVESLFG